jgi:hypothetical protein
VPLQAVLQAVIESPRRLDELSCARIVANIAEAVYAAQRAGQPPAALTPPAILVSPDGSIAFAAAAVSPRYLAPEKLRGGSGDRRSDVFTLGVMLWEVLAHEQLFAGDDEAARRAVLEAAIPPPSELNANVPAELDAICKHALARDPVERYQSARVMAADIDAVLDDAGYPESSEPIGRFIVAMAAPPPKPMAVVAPRAEKPHTTLRLPAVQPPAAIRPPTQRPVVPPPAATRPPTQPRAATQPAVLRPPAEPSPAAPPLVAARTAPLPSILPSPARETLPPPFVPRPILGSLSTPAKKSPLTRTAVLGSNASADATPVSPTTPPGAKAEPGGTFAPMPAPLGSFAPELDEATSLGPPAMPEPLAPAPAPDDVDESPAPKGSPRPSIANAETLATPELGMPPGMTVAPASPPAPLRTADSSLEDDDDGDFGQERHVDPAAVVALRRADRNTGGQDVLAGWGWGTDSVQSFADEDEVEVENAARASRKRLVIAIGGALGVVIVIAVAAFVFSGPPQPDPDAQVAARQATAAPSTAPADDHAASSPTAAPAAGEPARTEPPSTEPAGAAPSSPTTEPATAAASPPAPAASPPSPGPEPTGHAAAAPPASPAAQPPQAPRPAAPPPAAAAELPSPVAEPPPPPTKPAAEPPPPPAKAKIVAEPTRPPAKIVAEPTRPPKIAEPAKKPEVKKPAPRPPSDKALKRPAPPERIARAPKAQPIDPYATAPDTPRTDPAAAYRTGLQQYARGDTSGALATFRTLLSSNPSFAPAWRGLGLVYEKLGNTAQARSSLQRYLKLAPNASDADQIRARLEHLGSGS